MKNAFTLSEMIVVIAVLGLISVLITPNIVTGVQKKEQLSALKTVNSAIHDAITQTMIEERVTNLTNSTLGDSAEDFLNKYFKVKINCKDKYSNCLADSYSSLDKSNSVSATNMMQKKDFRCITTDSDAVVCITTMSADTETKHGKSVVVVDINGKNGPNINGRDLFNFEIYSDGKIGDRYELRKSDEQITSCTSNAATAGYGGNCYGKIIADGWKMDY